MNRPAKMAGAHANPISSQEVGEEASKTILCVLARPLRVMEPMQVDSKQGLREQQETKMLYTPLPPRLLPIDAPAGKVVTVGIAHVPGSHFCFVTQPPPNYVESFVKGVVAHRKKEEIFASRLQGKSLLLDNPTKEQTVDDIKKKRLEQRKKKRYTHALCFSLVS